MNTIKLWSDLKTDMPFQPKPRLPPIVYDFLAANYSGRPRSTIRHAEIGIRKLHDWMAENLYEFNDIGELQLNALEQRWIDEGLDIIYRRTVRESVHKYLIWVHGKGLFVGNLKELFPRMKPQQRMYVTLPDVALEYVNLIGARFTPKSGRRVKSMLRHLYLFIKSDPILMSEINRTYLEKFFIYVSKCGSASHRLCMLVCLRQYFRWLYEHEHLNEHPDNLIRSMDFPKLPKYLPRPLTIEADLLLQSKLESSNSNLHKALLLMRRTGIRVGEMRSLKFDCIKVDINDNHFLKVEIGKLKTERLVPLDNTTRAVVELIQAKTKEFDPKSEHLLRYHPSRGVEEQHLQLALNDLTRDIKTESPIVSHQLRHTFATTLLSAGMNLVVLRDILGHRDIRMTLRYAAVTQITVRDEYFRALENMESKYETPQLIQQSEAKFDLTVGDLIRQLKKHAANNDPAAKKKVALLIRRLQRMEEELSVIRIQNYI